ncbi:MAG: hypothetical protein JW801_18850 [Bacteroidales bacterium]|nr:hypothetical protein [Bacteroidales bacterium]
MNKEFASGNYLITLHGKYFGLLNTDEKLEGIEPVDDSSCKDAGDLIFDAWADPALSGAAGDDCLYTGTAMDPRGDYYLPSLANLMSESNDLCRSTAGSNCGVHTIHAILIKHCIRQKRGPAGQRSHLKFCSGNQCIL